MSDYLVTYDLADGSPDPHKPFLTAAETEGLLYVWQGQSYVSRLPDNDGVGSLSDKRQMRSRRSTEQSRKLSVKWDIRSNWKSGARSKLTILPLKSDRRKKPEARWTGASSFETSRLHQLNDPYFK